MTFKNGNVKKTTLSLFIYNFIKILKIVKKAFIRKIIEKF